MRKRPPGHVAFGQAVRQLRRERGLSQEALGYAAGLHRNYIGGVERGELNPTLATMQKIAAAFEMTTSELIAIAEALESVRKA